MFDDLTELYQQRILEAVEGKGETVLTETEKE